MTTAAKSRQSEVMKARWEQRKQALAAEQEQIGRLQEALDDCISYRERADARKMKAIEAARTIMTEALELIAYSYRSDIERRWKERWPWLEKSGE